MQVEGISYCPATPQTEDDLESLTPDTLQERAMTDPEHVFFSLFSGEGAEGADGVEAPGTHLVRYGAIASVRQYTSPRILSVGLPL